MPLVKKPVFEWSALKIPALEMPVIVADILRGRMHPNIQTVISSE
jgi:hypothetical protein